MPTSPRHFKQIRGLRSKNFKSSDRPPSASGPAASSNTHNPGIVVPALISHGNVDRRLGRRLSQLEPLPSIFV
jgi:hypothetical protein